MADELDDQHLNSGEDAERTTKEVILALGDDVRRCHKALLAAIDGAEDDTDPPDYPFVARQLVRAVFAYIEAVTFSLKVSAVTRLMNSGVEVSPEERYFAVEVDHNLNDKGQVVEKPAMIRLATNLRFAFALAERAFGVSKPFDPSVSWWSDFQSSIKVRDRLMHPKMPEDVDVSGDEILAVLKASHGFEAHVMSYRTPKRRIRKRAKRR